MLSQLKPSRVPGYSGDQIPPRTGRTCKKGASLRIREMFVTSAEKMLGARCCGPRSAALTSSSLKASSLEFSHCLEVSCCNGGGNALSRSRRLANGSDRIQRPRFSSISIPGRKRFEQHSLNCVGSVSSRQKSHHEEEVMVKEELMETQFVHWFREGSPYIQGHRSSTFVIVLPGEVTVDSLKMDGILQVLPSMIDSSSATSRALSCLDCNYRVLLGRISCGSFI